MGRAASELRKRRLADHRSGRRRRRIDTVLIYLALAVCLLLVAGLVVFCVDAALHPWWTRDAVTHARH